MTYTDFRQESQPNQCIFFKFSIKNHSLLSFWTNVYLCGCMFGVSIFYLVAVIDLLSRAYFPGCTCKQGDDRNYQVLPFSWFPISILYLVFIMFKHDEGMFQCNLVYRVYMHFVFIYVTLTILDST